MGKKKHLLFTLNMDTMLKVLHLIVHIANELHVIKKPIYLLALVCEKKVYVPVQISIMPCFITTMYVCACICACVSLRMSIYVFTLSVSLSNCRKKSLLFGKTWRNAKPQPSIPKATETYSFGVLGRRSPQPKKPAQRQHSFALGTFSNSICKGKFCCLRRGIGNLLAVIYSFRCNLSFILSIC